jgi:ligand-binding SRPBCC domain-containing protein
MIRTEPDGSFVLETEIVLNRPLRIVFDFFADPGNLERITPPWLNFRMLTEGPLTMRAGLRIDYRLQLHGIPLRWRSEIPVWQPPRCFVDRQLRGPYREWIHEHLFDPVAGGTRVRDRVRFRVAGGRWVLRWGVQGDLEQIFGYRTRMLRQIFSSSPEAVSP